MRRLLSGRWLVAHAVVLLIAVVFVNLGLWQLRRLDARRAANARLVRTVTITGRWDPSTQWLVSGRALGNRPGSHVVTPLVLPDGSAILVDRGWVALGAKPPVSLPEGTVTIRGTLLPSERRAPMTPSKISTVPGAIRRIDAPALRGSYRSHRLADQYLLLASPATAGVVVAPRGRVSEGPHKGYAVQWFLFTAVLLVGYAFVARRALAAPGRSADSSGLGPDSGPRPS